MDYYQGVVTDYLRADRAIFLNTEYCLQRNAAQNPDQSGPHWYVDALAADFRHQTIFLCEISYASGLSSLLTRLRAWQEHWEIIPEVLYRDSNLPKDWVIRPWLFVPESLVPSLIKKILPLTSGADRVIPIPRLTTLEMTQPWRYRSWNRDGETKKPDAIPLEMQN